MSSSPTPALSPQQRRGYWLRTLHQWHWISAAISLMGLLLFAVTGLTLNHAASLESKARITHIQAQLPAELVALLAPESGKAQAQESGRAELPAPLRLWLSQSHGIDTQGRRPEWSEDEVYVSMPGPGRDAWLSIQRADGALEYERSERGALAYLNDLHKGRNTGSAWAWFIDLIALACLVFTVTGLWLLALHARQRHATWPLVGAGLLAPVLLALLFIH